MWTAAVRRPLSLGENRELPEAYLLSEVIPLKAPHFPQLGDVVVYFRQGHQRYLDAVRSKDVYKLNANSEPWRNLDLRDHEVLKVIGIKCEFGPPKLCCLTLMNSNTSQSFSIEYQDMADVVDFIVLHQAYDTAFRRLWTHGDRFRHMINDSWRMGRIIERKPLHDEFPDSLFMCLNVRWDTGEFQSLSPWDLEPINENRAPAEARVCRIDDDEDEKVDEFNGNTPSTSTAKPKRRVGRPKKKGFRGKVRVNHCIAMEPVKQARSEPPNLLFRHGN